MRVIARHDGQIIDQSSSRNLLVQWILGIWSSKPPPNVRHLLVEEQNLIGVFSSYTLQPTFQLLCLSRVLAMPDFLNTAPYPFEERLHAEFSQDRSACSNAYDRHGIINGS